MCVSISACMYVPTQVRNKWDLWELELQISDCEPPWVLSTKPGSCVREPVLFTPADQLSCLILSFYPSKQLSGCNVALCSLEIKNNVF